MTTAFDQVAHPVADGSPPARTLAVLDTSALIADPDAIWAFADTDVVVPLVVIEELDGLKSRLDDTGRAARQALRNIEDLRSSNGGNIREAVEVGDNATFRVEPNGLHIDALVELGLDPAKPDNRLLAAALGQSEGAAGPVSVISNDTALRIKADQVGLGSAEHHRSGPADHRPAGWSMVETTSRTIDSVYNSRGVSVHEVELADAAHLDSISDNEFAVLRCGSQSVICRRQGDWLSPVPKHSAWDLAARSKEQRMALDLLMDPDVRVVGLEGGAGTGKTILALAAGLEQVMEVGRYARVAIFRPIIPVGRSELGFLPGSVEEKLDPWFAAIIDTLTALSDGQDEQLARRVIEDLQVQRRLTMESITFLRGRTLVNTYVLVDEAQNLESLTLKTILTRLGEGSKVVFTGDVSQIDQPYLSERTNALAVLRDRFRGQPLYGGVKLTSVERSVVAELADQLL